MIAAERHMSAMHASTTHAEPAPSVRDHSPLNDASPVRSQASPMMKKE